MVDRPGDACHGATAACSSTFNEGSAFTKDDSTAVTWSNGIALSDAYGINVDAWIRSGYTTRVALTYDFNQDGRRLCGTRGYIGDSPSQIVVKN